MWIMLEKHMMDDLHAKAHEGKKQHDGPFIQWTPSAWIGLSSITAEVTVIMTSLATLKSRFEECISGQERVSFPAIRGRHRDQYLMSAS